MTHSKILQEGTDAHYREPRYYDQIYRLRNEDLRFYVEQAERCGGPVLELGVGTGRVARALAEAGHEVHGVDRMPEMLERAEVRLSRLSRAKRELITLTQGDLRSLSLGRKFPLIISPFNVLMHLYTRADFEACLEVVKAHLEEGGRFAFDVLLPDLQALDRDPYRVYRCGHVRRPDDGKRYRYSESFDYDPISQVQIVRMIFEDEAGETFITPLAHRQFFPAELEALLHYGGFEIEARYGNFAGGLPTGYDESQVLIAKRRG